MGEDPAKILAMINCYQNVKDSRWLQLDVCREYQRGQCSRKDTDCKFAHPPSHVEVQNGKVTACYDSIKGRCQRDNPKCKYLHPPSHLKDQLLLNGRQSLAVRNMLTQLGTPAVAATAAATPTAAIMNPISAVGQAYSLPTMAAYSPYYLSAAQLYPGLVAAASPEAAAAMQVPSSYAFATNSFEGLNVNAMFSSVNPATATQMNAIAVAQGQNQAPKVSRSDRIEVCREFLRGACQRSENDCKFAHPAADVEKLSDGTVIVCMDFVRNGGSCNRETCRYFHPPAHLQASLKVSASRSVASPASLQQPQQSSVVAGCGTGNVYSTGQLPAMMAAMSSAVPASALAEFAAANGHSNLHLANVSAHQSISPLHASTVSSLPVNAAVLSAMMASASAASSQSPAGIFAAAGGGKKRPLEDPAAANSADSFLLAAAALQQQPSFKRIASDKNGVPMFQPVSALSSTYLQYPAQFAAYPFQIPAAAPMPIPLDCPAVGAAGFSPLTAALSSPDSVSSLICTSARVASNAASVAYFDETGQLLDTLPVCRDFKQNHCDRLNCRYVHLAEDYVEVSAEGKVTICRDYAKGKCLRNQCKYYHIPALSSSTGLQTALGAAAAVGNPGSVSSLLMGGLAARPVVGGQLLSAAALHSPPAMDATSLALLLAAQRQQQQYLAQPFGLLQALNATTGGSTENIFS